MNKTEVINYVKKLKEHHFEELEKQATCIFDEYDEAFKKLVK